MKPPFLVSAFPPAFCLFFCSNFRAQYRVLPKVIISASNLYGNNATYVSVVTQYLQKLRENTSDKDWDIKYFAAQTYISLASLGNRQTNLASAYDILVENIIYLSREQDEIMKTYNTEITMPTNVFGDQKKQAEKIVAELKKARKIELPPMHTGLALNYQTIFPLMDELNKTQAERLRVSGILSNTTVMPEFRHKYFGDAYNYTSKNFIVDRNITGAGDVVNGVVSIVGSSINWNKFSVELPAIFLSENSTIDVSIRDTRLHTFSAVNFTMLNVDRKKSTSASDYVCKVEIPLKDTITIEKEQNYTLSITIKTYDMTCSIVFTSPKGKTNFEYSRIE
ncbi:hypothetical protein FACS1894190_17950 [Spirochaetia bacterium]|nr:hypothetical protein FACS1894190_17950 [Spirochaetia bacterium]